MHIVVLHTLLDGKYTNNIMGNLHAGCTNIATYLLSHVQALLLLRLLGSRSIVGVTFSSMGTTSA